MKVETVKVTPSMARDWLTQIPSLQRRVAQTQVDKIAMAIRRGEWRENGATIVFDKGGKLLDGQHRLSAIVAADKPVYTLVARGVSSGEQTFVTIDDCLPRTLSNFLDCKHVTSVASIGKWLWHSQNDDFPWRRKKPPMADMRKLITPLIEEAEEAVNVTAKASRVVGHGSFLAFIHLHHAEVNPVADTDRLQLFFHKLGDGADLPGGSPVLALRNRFALGHRRHDSPKPIVARALVLKAFYAHLDNRKLSRVSWDAEKEVFPALR